MLLRRRFGVFVFRIAAGISCWPLRATRRIGEAFLRMVRYCSLRSRIKTKLSPRTQLDGRVFVVGTGSVSIGDCCRFGRHVVLETWGQGEVVIGDNVRLNAGVHIVAHERITIGSDCLIGEYSSVRDADHVVSLMSKTRTQGHHAKAIVIGSNVWIGRGVAVLKGVKVGDDVVIGANSVVTRDVAPRSVAAGVPARVLRRLVELEAEGRKEQST